MDRNKNKAAEQKSTRTHGPLQAPPPKTWPLIFFFTVIHPIMGVLTMCICIIWYPKSWMGYFMENPTIKCMMAGGTPISGNLRINPINELTSNRQYAYTMHPLLITVTCRSPSFPSQPQRFNQGRQHGSTIVNVSSCYG